MVLQRRFIFPMIAQGGGEGVVVGVGERVGGVVDQLAQGVVVKQLERFLPLQPGGNGTHEAPGIAVIVTPQPLAADGAFQVCSGIPIRLDASQQKGLHIPLRGVAHVVLHQVFSQTAVTFSAHVAAPSF